MPEGELKPHIPKTVEQKESKSYIPDETLEQAEARLTIGNIAR